MAWITDPHFNFISDKEMEEFVLQNLVKDKPDVFVVGGDIGESCNIDKYLRALANTGVKILYVCGNHDFYGSSFDVVNFRMKELVKSHPNLFWLDQEDYVELTSDCALVGAGSWADGRYGDWEGYDLDLNDYHHITDLAYVSKKDRLKVMQKFAKKATLHARKSLELAFEKYNKVYFVTHVPPWLEASVHEGKPSDDEWAPHFTCKVMGDMIVDYMDGLNGHLTVLCGHSHGKGECDVLPNVRVITGESKYGSPKVNRVFNL